MPDVIDRRPLQPVQPVSPGRAPLQRRRPPRREEPEDEPRERRRDRGGEGRDHVIDEYA